MTPMSRDSSLDEIKAVVKDCLSSLYESDAELFEGNEGKGLCERCIVFRFAHYLQNKLSDYYVDCDFNGSSFKNGQSWQPRSGKPIENPDGTTTNRFVDIIIHKRRQLQNNERNFLCFEIKKWNNYNKKQIEKDENNLDVMTRLYGYVYGFYISLHKSKEKTKWTIFQQGKPIESELNKVVFENENAN